MTDLRVAAQQALEFLDAEFGWSPGEAPRIDTLRTALAQPERKPLTEEEVGRVCAPLGFAQLSPVEIARAIEKAHGIGEK